VDIVHVSDVHFGRQDQQAVRALDRHLADNPPDLIAISGDLTQTGRRREFFEAEAWVNQLPAPVAMVPGNHDTPALNLVARLLGPFRRYRTAFGVHSASRVYANGLVALAHLNTAHGFQRRLDWSLGKVRRKEVAVAQAFFRDNRDATWKIVMCHHPLVDKGDTHVRGKTDGGRDALAALASSGVDLVLSGHTHVPGVSSYGEAGGAVTLVSAGTLSERTREDRASFNRIVIQPGNATIVQLAVIDGAVQEVKRDLVTGRATAPSA
jgi:3',5'-cyclic AMP phosphodiesterase CpdA